MPNLSEVRAEFPALAGGFAFLENAGGSQLPGKVIEAMREYQVESFVPKGAGYTKSDAATANVAAAHHLAEEMVNAAGVGKCVLGASTTALVAMVAEAYARDWRAGDEVIVAETNHEANAGPWARLERAGATVRMWPVDPVTFRCELSTLEGLLSERTRIVALPHVSNIVGQVEDVAKVAEMAHAVGAKVCADGVAYAPHRAVDVAALGVDWYVLSLYKTFAPHMAVLFGRDEAFGELVGPGHFFVPEKEVPYRWEPGAANHESCAGFLGLRPYLAFLAGHSEYAGRRTVEAAWAEMARLEAAPHARLVEGLRDLGVRFVGPGEARADTVPTVSFLMDEPSDAVAARVNGPERGLRNGNMYAVRLLDGLGIPRDPGVVRASLAHYNTVEEVEGLLGALGAS